LHSQAAEELLRALRDHLESRFDAPALGGQDAGKWQAVLAKWDTRCRMRRSWRHPKAPARLISTASWRDYMRTMSRCHGRPGGQVCLEAAATSADIAHTLSRRTCGIALDKRVRASEFTAVTDVTLAPESDRHRFERETLRDAGIEPIPREGFAVWVAKLRPMLSQ
jgi:hypothetical protein